MSHPIPDLDLLSPENRPVFKVRTCRHGAMVFLSNDTTIGKALEQYGEFAESENRLMTALVRPGDVVIDVGANVGTVALPLARAVGPRGQIHLFEPQPVVFQALCATFTLNGIMHGRVHRAAVGSRMGQVAIPVIGSEQAGNFGAIRVEAAGSGELTPLVTLDSFGFTQCRLIKIDVEGMDFEVLSGAADLVARTRPFVYMEAKEGPATQQAIAWLMTRSYDCYWHFAAFYSPDNFRGVKENVFGDIGDINLLAIPRESGIRASLPLIASPAARWLDDYQSHLAKTGSQS